MRMSRVKRHKARFKGYVTNFNNITVIIMAVVFSLGVIVGSIILNNMSNDDFSQIFSSWNVFLENNIKPDIFGSIIKYGKIIGLIWLFGFFKFGVLGVVSVLFWKGISVGFTSSFIVASTGNIGVFFVAKLYLVQTALLIPMCFAVGITAIRFSLKPASNTCLTPKKYCVFGLIQLIGILTLSLFDALIA